MVVTPGDIVRFERQGFWFYCQVDDVLDDGDVLGKVVDTQSWPDLVLRGFVPGRQYRLPGESVLSVIQTAC